MAKRMEVTYYSAVYMLYLNSFAMLGNRVDFVFKPSLIVKKF